MVRRAVGDRQHENVGIPMLVFAERGHNRAGAILLAFVAAFKMLAVPEVAIADNQPGDGFRKRDSRLLELGVEMAEFFRNLGAADSLDPFLGQFGGEAHTPVASLETLPLFRGHDHERVATMLGDNHRLMPGLVAQRAEGLLKLTCGNFGWFHAVISILAIIAKMVIFARQLS